MSRDMDDLIARAEATIAAQRERSKTSFERQPSGAIRWQGMPWAPAVARKRTTCAWSGRPIEKGDAVYLPLSHSNKRMLRVLAAEWERDDG